MGIMIAVKLYEGLYQFIRVGCFLHIKIKKYLK